MTATVNVTPVFNGNCTGNTVSFTVTVTPGAAGTITQTSPVVLMCPGNTMQLSTNGVSNGTSTWTSSSPSVATVSSSGLVTFVSGGTTMITYSVTTICGTSTSAPYNITVNPAANAGTITGPAAVCTGSSVPLSTNGTPGGFWLSLTPTIATVDLYSGMLTGVTPGTAQVIYLVTTPCGTASSLPYMLTVNAGAGSAGTIIGAPSACPGGNIVNLITTGNLGGTWASSNNAVATLIVPYNGGAIFQTGIAGTATITYTVPGGACGLGSIASFTLTVNPVGNTGTLTGPTSVCQNATIILGTSLPAGGAWYSGSPLVASVNQYGVVSGVAQGSATIYYSFATSCGAATESVTINVNPAASPGTITGPSAVCENATINLITSGTPGGTWSSSDNSIAIVDANGVVKGIASGIATIKYTVPATCASVPSTSVSVIVNPTPVAGTVSNGQVCAGLATTFTSSGGNTGGSWSSSNTAVATVNAGSGVVTGIAAGSATITYTVTSASGCGTATASGTVTVKPVLNAGTINGGSAVCMGSTLNLSTNGSSGGQWSSSVPGVATIDMATGVVTPVSPGTTTITYTLADNGCGAASVSGLITVNALANAGTLNNVAVCAGSSATMTMTGGAGGGSWSSSNTAIATVNATGVVTGVAQGSATITYTVTTSCGSASALGTVTVNPLPNAGTISGPASVCVATSINLIANGTPGGTWTTSAPSVATVNTSGKVTGMSTGTTTITYSVTSATGCGTSQATYTVSVNDVPDAGYLDGPPSVCVGASIFFNVVGGMPGGTWISTDDAIATVNAVTGQVKGISAGSVAIIYSITNGCGTSVAGTSIEVNSLPNAGTISGPSAVCAGSNINLSASGDPYGTWTSTNTLVATVNATTGIVHGVSQGSATIIYTVGSAGPCGTASATYLVSVNPVPNAGTVTGASSVCVGLSTAFSSSGSINGTWSSSNPSVATVDAASGAVTGVAAGLATIRYTVSTLTCGSATSSADITVNPLPVAGTINGPNSVCVNATINLSSTSSGGTWSSSANSIATVDMGTGAVTGHAAGNATITYSVTTSCGTSTATYSVNVNPLPNAGTISGGLFVCTGSTTSLSSSSPGGMWSSSNTAVATVNPTTGLVSGAGAGTSNITYTVTSGAGCGVAATSATVTVGDLPNAGAVTGAATLCGGSTAIFTSSGTGGGSWSSNNVAAATVDAVTGEVTGVAAGSATIIYTVGGACGSSSASANITINALPNAGAVNGQSALCVGGTTTFTSTGAAGGSWSSNNSLVATVNSGGLVTAVGPGSAGITYTVTNSCGPVSASKSITVNALPNAGVVSGASQLCVGASAPFGSNGDGGGTWSSDNVAVATVDAVTGMVHGEGPGSTLIKYTVTSTVGCGSAVSSAPITVNALPVAAITNNTGTLILTCSTTSINVTATGGGTYSWSGGLGNAASATITAPGVYTVTVTSASGCSSTASIAIAQDIAIPSAAITNNTGTTIITCTTPSINVTATGGGTYAWSGGLGSAAAATITAPGTYTVTVTAANGCTNTASITITSNTTPPTVGITNNTGTTVITCATPSVNVTATGGGTYSWSGGLGNAAAATITAPGTYTVTVTSANGCTNTAAIDITENTTPPAAPIAGTPTQPSCGTPTGSVVLSGLPATGTWTLTRSPGGTTTGTGSSATITGLPANTTYTFTVTNNVGCVSGPSADVIINAAPANPAAPTVGTITQPNCISPTGSVVLNGLPASGTWTLTRAPGGTTTTGTGTSATVTGLPANGNYTFTVTNAAGCTSLPSANVAIGAGTLAPGITVSNITVSTDPNSCNALVTLGPNITVTGSPTTVQYRIGILWFSYPIASTHTFFRGTTPITVVASNSCGSVTRIFLVTVVDDQGPVVNCVPNATRSSNGNTGRYSVHGHEFDASASDGCGVSSLIYSLSGATTAAFNSNNRSLNNVKLNVGTTTITWRATDVNGNVSTCTTLVTVNGSGNTSAYRNNDNDVDSDPLTVKVAPNPTSYYFTLQFKSVSNEKMKINVTDLAGRVIEKMPDVPANSTLQMGHRYHPGIYFTEVMQGKQKVVLRLIKEGK